MKRILGVVAAGVLLIGAFVIPKAFARLDNNRITQFNNPGFQVTQTDTQLPTTIGSDNQVPEINQQNNQTPKLTKPNNDWHDQMFDWHKQWIDNAEKNGQLSPEQAQAWRQHFDYMEEFHDKYGMGMMMGGNGFGGMMGGPNGFGGMMGQ